MRLELQTNGKLPVAERPKIVEWVNQLLCLHKGSTIEEYFFKFRMNFMRESGKSSLINGLSFSQKES